MIQCKLTPWYISQATKVAIAPVVATLSFWQAYWTTFSSVKWPEGAK